MRISRKMRHMAVGVVVTAGVLGAALPASAGSIPPNTRPPACKWVTVKGKKVWRC